MDYFTWDIDPIIFRLGPIAPRYYGAMFALGFLLGYSFMEKVFKREGKDPEDLSSLLMHLMLGTVIGARLGHCFFYEPAKYLADPLAILKIWEGGLASHGGGIGVLVALFLYRRKRQDQGYLWLADRLAGPVALTGCFIRIGNFFNSEIIGNPTTVPWAVIFKRIDHLPRHPSMLYESFTYLTLAIVLMLWYRKAGPEIKEGRPIGLLFIWIFTGRFLIEFTKKNQVAFEEGMLLNMGQLLSIPFVILGLVLITGFYKKLINQDT